MALPTVEELELSLGMRKATGLPSVEELERSLGVSKPEPKRRLPSVGIGMGWTSYLPPNYAFPKKEPRASEPAPLSTEQSLARIDLPKAIPDIPYEAPEIGVGERDETLFGIGRAPGRVLQTLPPSVKVPEEETYTEEEVGRLKRTLAGDVGGDALSTLEGEPTIAGTIQGLDPFGAKYKIAKRIKALRASGVPALKIAKHSGLIRKLPFVLPGVKKSLGVAALAGGIASSEEMEQAIAEELVRYQEQGNPENLSAEEYRARLDALESRHRTALAWEKQQGSGLKNAAERLGMVGILRPILGFGELLQTTGEKLRMAPSGSSALMAHGIESAFADVLPAPKMKPGMKPSLGSTLLYGATDFAAAMPMFLGIAGAVSKIGKLPKVFSSIAAFTGHGAITSEHGRTWGGLVENATWGAVFHGLGKVKVPKYGKAPGLAPKVANEALRGTVLASLGWNMAALDEARQSGTMKHWFEATPDKVAHTLLLPAFHMFGVGTQARTMRKMQGRMAEAYVHALDLTRGGRVPYNVALKQARSALKGAFRHIGDMTPEKMVKYGRRVIDVDLQMERRAVDMLANYDRFKFRQGKVAETAVVGTIRSLLPDISEKAIRSVIKNLRNVEDLSPQQRGEVLNVALHMIREGQHVGAAIEAARAQFSPAAEAAGESLSARHLFPEPKKPPSMGLRIGALGGALDLAVAQTKMVEARGVVKRTRSANTSVLMREMGIERPEAKRLLDMLEKEGSVSKPDSEGIRDVLIKREMVSGEDALPIEGRRARNLVSGEEGRLGGGPIITPPPGGGRGGPGAPETRTQRPEIPLSPFAPPSDTLKGAERPGRAGKRALEGEPGAGRREKVEDVEVEKRGGVGDRRFMEDLRRSLDKMQAGAEREGKKKAARATMTDPVTGLGTRAAYEDAPKKKKHIFVDLDDLKRVNDTEGHAAGDRLLKNAAEAMEGEGATAYRIGGDEFVIMADSLAEANALRDRVRSAGEKKGVRMSIGIGESLEAADKAMYADKKARKAGRVVESNEPGLRVDVGAQRGFREVDVKREGKEPSKITVSTAPVYEVPVKEIKLSKDVPNFKGDADPESGVVEPLQGEWRRDPINPIVIWERNNGDLEVITGRHRLDLAKRRDVENIDAQIFSEKDGFTKKQAMVLDAESNIRDNQGEVADYAWYFRNTPEITEGYAKKEGLLRGAKGRDGWRLGKGATATLWDNFVGKDIEVGKSVAIAEGAPNNEAVQTAVISHLQNNPRMTIDETSAMARRLTTVKPRESATGEQSLPGFENVLIEDIATESGAAAKFKRAAIKEIGVIRNALRLGGEAGQKALDNAGMKLKIRNKKTVEKRLKDLQRQAVRWAEYERYPELVREAREAAGLDPGDIEGSYQAPAPKPAPPEKPKKEPRETTGGSYNGVDLSKMDPDYISDAKSDIDLLMKQGFRAKDISIVKGRMVDRPEYPDSVEQIALPKTGSKYLPDGHLELQRTPNGKWLIEWDLPIDGGGQSYTWILDKVHNSRVEAMRYAKESIAERVRQIKAVRTNPAATKKKAESVSKRAYQEIDKLIKAEQEKPTEKPLVDANHARRRISLLVKQIEKGLATKGDRVGKSGKNDYLDARYDELKSHIKALRDQGDLDSRTIVLLRDHSKVFDQDALDKYLPEHKPKPAEKIPPEKQTDLYNLMIDLRGEGKPVSRKQIEQYDLVTSGKHTVDEVVNYLKVEGVEVKPKKGPKPGSAAWIAEQKAKGKGGRKLESETVTDIELKQALISLGRGEETLKAGEILERKYGKEVADEMIHRPKTGKRKIWMPAGGDEIIKEAEIRTLLGRGWTNEQLREEMPKIADRENARVDSERRARAKDLAKGDAALEKKLRAELGVGEKPFDVNKAISKAVKDGLKPPVEKPVTTEPAEKEPSEMTPEEVVAAYRTEKTKPDAGSWDIDVVDYAAKQVGKTLKKLGAEWKQNSDLLGKGETPSKDIGPVNDRLKWLEERGHVQVAWDNQGNPYYARSGIERPKWLGVGSEAEITSLPDRPGGGAPGTAKGAKAPVERSGWAFHEKDGLYEHESGIYAVAGTNPENMELLTRQYDRGDKSYSYETPRKEKTRFQGSAEEVMAEAERRYAYLEKREGKPIRKGSLYGEKRAGERTGKGTIKIWELSQEEYVAGEVEELAKRGLLPKKDTIAKMHRDHVESALSEGLLSRALARQLGHDKAYPDLFGEASQPKRADKRVAKFRNMADGIDEKVAEMRRPSTQNVTPKRAAEWAAKGREADHLEKVGQAMRRMADQVEKGELDPLLEPIDSKAHVDDILRGHKFEGAYIHKDTLRNLLDASKGLRGAKQLRDHVTMLHQDVGAGQHGYITWNVANVDAIRILYGKVKKAGKDKWVSVDVARDLRMLKAGIDSPEKFLKTKKALEALVEGKTAEQIAKDRVAELERGLVGVKIPGFFPTPKPVIDKMLIQAGIGAGDRVLEPSAGKGDILDAIKKAHPDAEAHGIELSTSLVDILKAKGHDVHQADFLETSGNLSGRGGPDRIVMNPPFEKGQDIKHVKHAYRLLAPGGRLVAIMSESPFFGEGKSAKAFRKWLDDVGGQSELLPEGSFKGSESFRQTNVNARIVTIDKPGDGGTAVGRPAEPSRAKNRRQAAETALERSEDPQDPMAELNESPEVKGRIQAAANRGQGSGVLPPLAGPLPESKVGRKFKRKSDLIDYIVKTIQRPIRVGRMPKGGGVRGALGVYITPPEAIRIKYANDVETGVHEAGHHISGMVFDQNYSRLSWDARRELDTAGRNLYGNKRPAVSYVDEGWAEFLSHYVTDRGRLKTEYPATLREAEPILETDLPDVYRALQEVRQGWEHLHSKDLTEQMRRHIVRGQKEKKERASWYARLIDDQNAIKQAVRLLTGGKGVADPMRDPWTLTQSLRGVTDMALTWLRYGGPAEFKNRTPIKGAQPLREILRPIEKGAQEEDFGVYLVARRVNEDLLPKVGGKAKKIQGFSPAEWKKVQVIHEKKNPKFKDVANDLYAYQDHLLRYLRDSGVISRKLYDTLQQYDAYAPLFKVMDAEGSGQAGRALADVFNPIKRIQDSSRHIHDPLESIVKNTYTYLALAERNRVMTSFGDLARTVKGAARVLQEIEPKVVPEHIGLKSIAPELKKLGIEVPKDVLNEMLTLFRPNAFLPETNVVRYFRNGKPRLLDVGGLRKGESDLYRAFKSMDKETAGLMMKIFRTPTRLLRFGSVSTPTFAFYRNPTRDILSAYVLNPGYKVPVLGPGRDLMEGLWHWARGGSSEAYQTWLRHGGSMATEATMDRAHLEQSLRNLRRYGLKGRTVQFLRHPVDSWRGISAMMEEGLRIGRTARLIRNGEHPLAATMDARDLTLDFGRAGYWGRSANQVIAFWNANVQEWNKMYRAFHQRPVSTLAKALGSITIPSLALEYMYKDDPDYQKMPAWMRNFFWPIRVRDSWIFIPKPHALGIIFGSVPQNAMRGWLQDDPDGQWVRDIGQAFGQGVVPGIVPTALTPIVNVWANWSSFLDRPVVPRRMENIDQARVRTDRTSDIIYDINDALQSLVPMRISAPQIEEFIFGYTGSMGRSALEGADWVYRKATKPGAPAKPAKAPLGGIPILSKVVRPSVDVQRYPVDRLYEMYNRAKMAKNTLDKHPDDAAMLERHSDWRDLFGQLSGTVKSLSALHEERRQVIDDPKMTPFEKKKRLDDLQREIIAIADEALKEAHDEIRKWKKGR